MQGRKKWLWSLECASKLPERGLEAPGQAQLQRAGTVVLTSHQGVALDDTPHQVLTL